MEATIVAKDQLLLAAIQATGNIANNELEKNVRNAWMELQNKLQADSQLLANPKIGYVIYPQWGKDRLSEQQKVWVGQQISSIDGLPEDLKAITIPGRRYAAAVCQGNREHMYRMYGELREWTGEHGVLIDTSEGAWTVEAYKLSPSNPFDIPADEINAFDFDILYAIK